MTLICREIIFVAALGLALAVLPRPPAFAHGGQIEVNNSGPRGPITLSTVQTKALGLLTVQATLRPIAHLLRTHGEVAALPDKQAEVSLRISGNVQAVFVNIGDAVHAGQKLALVQSRVIGNPPPTVAVTAPMDGVIDARNVIAGQSIEPNTAFFSRHS